MNNTAKKLETAPINEEMIRAWLTDYVARLLKLDADSVDGEARFESFGLDSASTVGLAGDLSEWLGRKIDPSLPYDHPTIDQLAKRLAKG